MNVPRHLQRWLRPPKFPDVEKTRQARLLYGFLLMGFAASLTFVVLWRLFIPEDQAYQLIYLSLVVLPALMVLTRRGAVRLAAILTSLCIWVLVLLASMFYGGLSDNVFAYLALPVVLAGLLVDGRMALLVALGSSAAGFAQVVDANFPPTLVGDWIGTTAIFLLVTLIVWIAYGNATESLRQVVDSNRTLYDEIERHNRTAAALRDSEERYRLLLDSLPAAISVIHNDTLEVLYVNTAAARLVRAKSRDALLGIPATALVAPDSLGYVAEQIERVRKTRLVQTANWQLQALDGTHIPVENVALTIQYDGKPAILSIYTDVTQRMQLEQERLRADEARAELEQERRAVQTRENLLNTASHQFRTPLSIIVSAQDMLKRYESRMTDAQRRERYDIIGEQVAYMRALLEDLLAINKASAGALEFRPEPLTLTPYFSRLVEDFASAHPSHRFSFAGDIPGSYQLDPKLTRHIVNNLLSNAMKYSPTGSTVDVTLHEEESRAVIRVRDEGIGIAPQDLEHIFEAFFRAGNARDIQGTGLGLTIVKNSVETQGGTIRVDSQTGLGTTFTVMLPLRPAPDYVSAG